MDSMSIDDGKVPPKVALVLPPPQKPKIIRRINRRKYIEVLTIRDGTGKGARTSQVACSAKDNRLENIIVASKLRNLIEKQVDLYMDGTLTGIKIAPKDLLETTQALEKVAAVTYRAHGDVVGKEKEIPDLPPPQNNQTNIGNLIIGAGQTNKTMEDILASVKNVTHTKNLDGSK